MRPLLIDLFWRNAAYDRPELNYSQLTGIGASRRVLVLCRDGAILVGYLTGSVDREASWAYGLDGGLIGDEYEWADFPEYTEAWNKENPIDNAHGLYLVRIAVGSLEVAIWTEHNWIAYPGFRSWSPDKISGWLQLK